MDFIVLGTILGAIMMVVGTVLRDLVPRRLPVGDDEAPWVTVRDRRRVVRVSLLGGRVATIAGVTILLTTLVLVLIDPSDRVALTLVIGLSILAFLGCAGWIVWYRYQESTGAIQRRQLRAIARRLGRVDEPTSSDRTSASRGASQTGAVDDRASDGRPVMAPSARSATSRRDGRRDERGHRDQEPVSPNRARPAGDAASRGRTRPRLDDRDQASTRSPVPSASLGRPQRQPGRDVPQRTPASAGRRVDSGDED